MGYFGIGPAAGGGTTPLPAGQLLNENALAPEALTNLRHWFAADRSSFVDGTNVVAWSNLRNGANNWAQSNASLQPLDHTYSGNPAVRFWNGTVAGRHFGTAGELINTAAPHTQPADFVLPDDWHIFIVFVCEAVTLNSGNRRANHRLLGNTNSNRFFGITTRDNGGTPEVSPWFWRGSEAFNDHTITLSQIHLLEYSYDGTDLVSRLDASAAITNSVGGGSQVSSGGVVLLGGDSGQDFRGGCLEIIVSDHEGNATTVNNVRSYLGTKYSVSV
jgi:hypothetical protein